MLSQNSMGFVGKCACCNEIQLQVGALLCHLAESDYELLREAVDALVKQQGPVLVAPDGQALWALHLPLKGWLLAFSAAEWQAVRELLDEATWMLNVQKWVS